MSAEPRQTDPDSNEAARPSCVLVVYYSRTGKTRQVAEDIATDLGGDIEEIIDTKKRSGPVGFLTAGRDSGRGSLTTIGAPNKDPSAYDLVIVGTPVWNNTVSTPIRTYLSMQKDKIVRSAFFLTQDRKESETFAAMQEVLGKKPIATLQLIGVKRLDKADYRKKLDGFQDLIRSGSSK
jgi:flavodoxin